MQSVRSDGEKRMATFTKALRSLEPGPSVSIPKMRRDGAYLTRGALSKFPQALLALNFAVTLDANW